MCNFLKGQKKLLVVLGVFFLPKLYFSFRFLVGLTSMSVNSDLWVCIFLFGLV